MPFQDSRPIPLSNEGNLKAYFMLENIEELEKAKYFM
jgi:hypothetical protein